MSATSGNGKRAASAERPSSRAVVERALVALEEMQAKLAAGERARCEPIAVIGLGCRFPGGASDPDSYWRLLRDGVDAVREVPPDRWDAAAYYDPDPEAPGRSLLREGGFLDRIDLFDAHFFGIAPREATRLDPQHRLFLEVAWEALEHAGLAPDKLAGSRTGVFLGLTLSEYLQLEGRAVGLDGIDAYLMPGCVPSAAAGRLSHLLGLQGPSLAVDTACSSSLVAAHLACQSLRTGDSDVALAGGVNALVVPETFVAFSKLGMVSPTGRCRTFSAAADGFVRGEGCGVVVLKRLSDALADRDPVLAVVLGSAVNQDGASSGLAVPNGLAQVAVIRDALERARVDPADVAYVEAHGTGTTLGDPIEAEALAEAFGTGRREPLLVGAVKTNLGHLEAASGVAGLIKVVLAVARGAVPANLHFDAPSPHIPWQTAPLAVPSRLTPWPASGRRLAGVSAFGYSGTNAHLVLAEAPARAREEPAPERPLHLLSLSAKRPEALAELAGRFERRLGDDPPPRLADVCHTAGVGRSHFPERIAIVARDLAEARAALAAARAGAGARGLARGRAPAGRLPKVAFLCPGEARRGTGRALYETQPVFREALERYEALGGELGRPLLGELFPGEADGSARGLLEAPALVALQLALAELWRSFGVEPAALVGAGAGAIAAAALADAISAEDALRLAAGAAGAPESIPWVPPRLPLLSAATGEPFALDDLREARAGVSLDPEPMLAALRGRGAELFVALGPADSGPARVLPSAGGDDWRALLETLGALYVSGIEVDWAGVDRSFGAERVVLPTYAFQRQRFWVEGASPAPPPAAARPHPLLGERLRSPALSELVLPCLLAEPPAAYLREHRVHGEPVLPLAATLELALAGGAEALGAETVALDDVVVHAPLSLPERSGDLDAQLLIGTAEAGEASFRLASAAGGESDWRLHVAGRVGTRVPAQTAAEPIAALRARCADELPVQELYASLRRRGIELGPPFQGIVRLVRGAGEALAEIVLPEGLDARNCRLHPALLDACLQTFAAAWPADLDAGSHTYLPVSIDRLVLRRRAGERVHCHARLRDASLDSLTGDLRLLDEDGAAVAELEGLLVRRTAPVDERGAVADENWRDWLYGLAWEPRRGASVAALAGGLRPETEATRFPLGELEALGADVALGALRELGWSPAPGEEVRPAALADRLGVVAPKRRLLGRLLAILAEEGVLAARGGGFEVVAAPERGDPASRLAALRGEHGGSPELALFARCAPRLADVLRGACDPLELLFPGGSAAELAELYRDSAAARFASVLAAKAAARTASTAPADRPFRVLEVGAGTGGTTSHVLPRLPAGRTEYLYTDVSPFLVDRARKELDDHALSFGVLDLERDPAAQGLAGRRFDLVLAANVLHATEDLRRTLAHLRGLLADDGLLVIVEGLARRRWVDLTFGLTDGWWSFADPELRADYPLLPAERWLRLLHEAGLGRAEAVLAGESDAPLPQAVLLARASAHPAPGPFLLLGGAEGAGERVAASLERRGERALHAPAGAGEPERALAEAVSAGEPPRTVVHLGSLDTALGAEADAAELAATERAVLGGLLELVQALVRRQDPPRLVVVTRGAQAVAGNGAPAPAADPLHGAVWGLGRVVTLEHPELGCALVDLDAAEDGAIAAEQLADLLRAPAGDPELALRAGRGLVPVLGPAARDARAAQPPDASLQLQATTPGSLESLALRPSARRPPGPGEVEIRVRATGLNFRDVLNALGEYPGGAGPLGGECAGEVTAVGAGVRELEVGDPVVALAVGSFASHVTTRAELVARKPARLGFAEAATIPAAFLTAEYALGRLARISAGEKVLVHAAAGGVGLAAIRIAKRAGATVYATAGSPEKRAFLESAGVERTLSSRTLAFAEELRALTGGRGVDVVLDTLGGESLPASMSVLAEGGRFVELAKRRVWDAERASRERPDMSYFLVDLAAEAERDPETIGALLRALVAEADAGALAPLPLRVYPVERAAEAFRFMAQARHVGKIVITQGGGQPVRRDRTYLVTGGLGGIGLLAAARLVERGARHLVLAGRSEPAEETAAAIRRMEAGGARVSAARCDVSSESEVERLLAELAGSWPPLAGVVHSAGVLDDAALVAQEWSRFATVLAPKAHGAWILHRATRGLALDFFVLFSSGSATLGSAGQGNHAAANGFLDALAADRRSLGLPALAIGWGRWAEVGAAARPELGERLAGRGLGSIDPARGLAAFDHLLDLAVAERVPPHVAVLPLATAERAGCPGEPVVPSHPLAKNGLASALVAHAGSVAAGPEERPLRRRLAESPEDARRQLLLGHVRRRAVEVLGLRPGDPIDPAQPLGELGLDSLMAVELRNFLGADLELGRRLPATLVFDYPTLDALTGRLAASLDGNRNPDGAAAPPVAGREPLVAGLETMTEAEAEALLVAELARPEAQA